MESSKHERHIQREKSINYQMVVNALTKVNITSTNKFASPTETQLQSWITWVIVTLYKITKIKNGVTFKNYSWVSMM